MGTFRYKLSLSDSGTCGIMITNTDSLEKDVIIKESFLNPPIRVAMLKSNRTYLHDCLVGKKNSWISDMQESVLTGSVPGWRLTEVEFRRRSPRLGFRNEGCGVENLYLADDVCTILAFEVYRGRNMPPIVYTVDHRWELLGKDGHKTYLTSRVEESIGGKVRKRIEFDISRDPEHRTPEFYAKRPEKHIIITEFY